MQEDWSHHTIVEQMADRYYDRVLCFARQLTDPHTAEDVTQEVFLRLSKLENLEDRVLTVSYLLKIAHNLVRGKSRRDKRFHSIARELVETAPHISVERKPNSSRTRGASESPFDRMHGVGLTQNEQSAIALTVGRGLSLREASEALGVKVSTVTNWKYRGLRKLAQQGDSAYAAA